MSENEKKYSFFSIFLHSRSMAKAKSNAQVFLKWILKRNQKPHLKRLLQKIQQRSTKCRACYCIETNYARANSGDGYAQIKTRAHGQIFQVLVHQLVEAVHENRVPEAGKEQMTISHLCGNRKCVNKFHLTYEHLDINKSRLCCQLFMGCFIPGTQIRYRCPHSPPCRSCCTQH